MLFDEADWAHRSPQLQALVRELLAYNPAKRLSAEELMAHPFLTGVEP